MILDELPMEKDEDQENEALQREGARLMRRHQRLPLMKRK